MPKVDLGNKHTCENCGKKFYDMKKDPAVCPACGTEVKPPAPSKGKGRSKKKASGRRSALPKPPVVEATEDEEDEVGAEFDDAAGFDDDALGDELDGDDLDLPAGAGAADDDLDA